MVPPSISIEGRGRWVSTKVGVWNGGFGPHQPFQSGSSCQPGGPNLLAPMISAPVPSRAPAKALSTPSLPPRHPSRTGWRTSTRADARPHVRRVLRGLRLAGGEAVEGDGEELDAGKRHGGPPLPIGSILGSHDGCPHVMTSRPVAGGRGNGVAISTDSRCRGCPAHHTAHRQRTPDYAATTALVEILASLA